MGQTPKLTERERELLSLYGPDTYAIHLPRDDAAAMETKGLVTWVPGVFGGIDWQITDAGRAAVAQVEA